jgi:hypothetical protein
MQLARPELNGRNLIAADSADKVIITRFTLNIVTTAVSADAGS